jgi:hypothetical protein
MTTPEVGARKAYRHEAGEYGEKRREAFVGSAPAFVRGFKLIVGQGPPSISSDKRRVSAKLSSAAVNWDDSVYR